MADSPDKTDESAEQAYASASAELIASKQAEPAAKAAPKPASAPHKAPATPVKSTPVKSIPAKSTRAKSTPAKAAAARRKPAAKPKPAAVKAARRAKRVAKAAAKPPVRKLISPKPTVTELKEKIMATKTTDFTQPIAATFGEIQTRAKAAYEKGTEVASEVTEFTKGNVEALVESSKIFATGAQSLGKTYVEEAKSAYETISADMKELAAVKSPAELFQLQGKIMRRNLDALVATTSKNGEAALKLANDTFAPLSGRANVAAEKLAKVA